MIDDFDIEDFRLKSMDQLKPRKERDRMIFEIRFEYGPTEWDMIMNIFRIRQRKGADMDFYNPRSIDFGHGQKNQNEDGAIGDWTLWKWLSWGPKTFLNKVKLPDGLHKKFDCLYFGHEIETKHTRHGRKYGTGNPHLIINPDITDTRANIFVLTYEPTSKRNIVEVAGWLTRDEFVERFEMRDFGYNRDAAPSVRFDELNRPEKLKDFVTSQPIQNHPHADLFGPFSFEETITELKEVLSQLDRLPGRG